MLYRLATPQDIPVLIELRKRQLIDEGSTPDTIIDNELNTFFERNFRDNSLVQWIVEEQDEIIATAGVIFYAFPPSYTNASGIKGYITNVYTHTSYRGQGLASALLDKLVSEAKKRHVPVLLLEASTMGKPVYQKYGFTEMATWMIYRLNLSF